ncbi:histidinol-phosphate transaminase [Tenacibaculum finnmarkense]|uniref:histidinol-phosphate transaminase n=1 Tax=Tenacibaculum finnmarkense TaxID=2781243 RepID=UPI001E286B62|nr:histidinol-phosphate transaminase [Tenacibaculum finnmarkense]MCD8400021.1 histidinol-phosphate transaminase [Tenacibaculum finnmarkense genomovar ulcerans]MCG8785372.1 histidinol-phosphate transaminase [Tenacibaculum finnmarkense]MCG8812727.1 histidinol-phosphate transaminase [Tenacibaculum finnmarkense]
MFNLDKIVRPNIKKLKAYSSARDEFKGTAEVYLDANENPFGDLNRYPDPKQIKIKKRLSEIKKVAENQIFIGNGSDEVIDLAFRIFCEPSKDKALTFSPTYGMYDVSAGINDVELIKQPLVNDFQISLNQLEPYLDMEDVKIIFICSPNNPTGNCFDDETIEYILENFNGVVLIDEAYIDFSSRASYSTKLEKYPNLIVSQTFSKAWGLAGVRVGAAYANRQVIDLYNKVKPPYNVSALNQEAVLKSLGNLDEFEINKNNIINEKETLINELKKIDFVKKIYPSEANFILIEVTNADLIYNKLVSEKIIIRNRTTLIDNCLRITVGKSEENRKLIKTLANLTGF